MQFSYGAYRGLLQALDRGGYRVCSYHDYDRPDRCVILRHDVDNSLDQALAMAKLEQSLGVCSTYFVLLKTDFYNPASRKNLQILRDMAAMGHEVGLHFDELSYEAQGDEVPALIRREADILGDICGFPIRSVSMHRPSQNTLESNWDIPGMVNSYGKTFFRDFKYLSDSRCRWREPVMDIIDSGEYERLHILTHPFWYHDEDQSIGQSVGNFVTAANAERYESMRENITDIDSILDKSEWDALRARKG